MKSMTGYGRHEAVVGNKKILAEVRSVNHRYSDYNIKLPRHYYFLEERVRKLAAGYIARGKVDIMITIETCNGDDRDILLDKSGAESYIKALYELRDSFGLKDDISVMSVARNSEIFKVERREEDQDELWSCVEPVLKEALELFCQMRQREGERIRADLENRVGYMRTLAARIEERSPETVEEYQKKLYAKIKELLGSDAPDEQRILTETAIFADKVAVNEETVRLDSHFKEFCEITASELPAGRRLDFLVQEINREINTIGSKASDIEISKLVLELKGELEKLREQIQNIE